VRSCGTSQPERYILVYRVLFTKIADKTLRKLPRNTAQRIRRSLDDLATNPYAEHLDVTKLQNRPGYRLRVGDWRVIYEIENDELTVLVLRIGLRGEVYR
jgi:mRNA interferase RelE/StbE